VTFTYGNATTGGALGGEGAHLLVSGELADHEHVAFINDPTHGHPGSTTTANSLIGGFGLQPGSGAASGAAAVTIAPAATGVRVWDGFTLDRTAGMSSPSGSAHNNMPWFMLGTWYLKL
jgi:hypothetical protein